MVEFLPELLSDGQSVILLPIAIRRYVDEDTLCGRRECHGHGCRDWGCQLSRGRYGLADKWEWSTTDLDLDSNRRGCGEFGKRGFCCSSGGIACRFRCIMSAFCFSHGCYLERRPFWETFIAPLLIKREMVREIAQTLEAYLHRSGGNHNECLVR
jgi:hypothetical protein